MAALTAYFPMGSNVTYLFGSAGFQFGDRTQAICELSGGVEGVEHRFRPNFGISAWMSSFATTEA